MASLITPCRDNHGINDTCIWRPKTLGNDAALARHCPFCLEVLCREDSSAATRADSPPGLGKRFALVLRLLDGGRAQAPRARVFAVECCVTVWMCTRCAIITGCKALEMEVHDSVWNALDAVAPSPGAETAAPLPLAAASM